MNLSDDNLGFNIIIDDDLEDHNGVLATIMEEDK